MSKPVLDFVSGTVLNLYDVGAIQRLLDLPGLLAHHLHPSLPGLSYCSKL